MNDDLTRPALPFYIVLDRSGSMEEKDAEGVSKLDAANDALRSVATTITKNPILADKVRFGVIAFSGTAEEVLPLCDLSEQTNLPRLSTEWDGTKYTAALRELGRVIEKDYKQLRADGFKVARPCAFFISDGEPTEDPGWPGAHAALVKPYDPSDQSGNRRWPWIVPFGVDAADRTVMTELIHPKRPERGSRAFFQGEGVTAQEAIEQIAKIIGQSILSSAQSVEQGDQDVAPNFDVMNDTEDDILDSTTGFDPNGPWLDDDEED